MESVLHLIDANICYISYFSKIPLYQQHSNRMVKQENSEKYKNIDNGNDYNLLFGHIVMSVGFISDFMEEFPIVCHYGIFKNPPYFFDPDGKYANLSMFLHGFTAKMALTYFNNKKYMINSPLESMVKIMTNKLNKNTINIGTNEDIKNIELLEEDEKILLKTYPPRIHINSMNIWSIAREGVDLKKYPDVLPQELIEYTTNIPNKSFNLGGETIGSFLVMVNLLALASVLNI
ncbi:hypothetical protein QLL95_gp0010 [Cotonvirus japonicus]|uniref:Uncharacterized protein n=1 Tax=Cotonvirus japonicus TaxID=2811091 RepID=A0ABM7NQR0_9VIRU|nr:hypothetical protein QLL95_gp0010 [Cotonvirus japonicus]BCS82499.1 hypothetical protein [Cotonvirus japonicus]